MAAGNGKSNGNGNGHGERAGPGRRVARREALGLTAREFATLERLATPQKIQAFLNAIPINHEIGGETVLSVREVLRQRRAHCIEGAMLAAAALWVHGEPPLVMHLDCHESDFPHVITLFRRHGAWGAISKTNGAPLRYRDPIYRTLRELALSYFHEYSNRRGHKTLRSYSTSFDMRRLDPKDWITSQESCWVAHDRITALRHFALISRRQEKLLAKRDAFERKASKLVEYPRPELETA
ncbi:MAG: hypothetical protein H7Y14_11930 [Burkholderiales bacterium]|nr:hypothetical protein [Burkholderiales bacterium]